MQVRTVHGMRAFGGEGLGIRVRDLLRLFRREIAKMLLLGAARLSIFICGHVIGPLLPVVWAVDVVQDAKRVVIARLDRDVLLLTEERHSTLLPFGRRGEDGWQATPKHGVSCPRARALPNTKHEW